MFVRWRRRSSGRLVHNQRVDGRVRQHHVGGLGAISAAALDPANTMEGIVARRAFWRTANATLARFSDRIDASLEGTIRAALQGRVPTVTPKELRRLSLLEAEREGRCWRTLVEDSRLSTAGQEGQSTEREEQLRLYQIRQWGAEARYAILRDGIAIRSAPASNRRTTSRRSAPR